MNFLPLLNVLDIISNDNNGQRLTKSGNVIQMLDGFEYVINRINKVPEINRSFKVF